MRSNAYIDVGPFRRFHISVAFRCVHVIQVVWTPENVAFWMRSNAASLLAVKRSRTRFESKNIYMGTRYPDTPLYLCEVRCFEVLWFGYRVSGILTKPPKAPVRSLISFSPPWRTKRPLFIRRGTKEDRSKERWWDQRSEEGGKRRERCT